MTQSSSNKKPEPRAGVLQINAYVPGDSKASGEKIHKLSSNESPLGPSPAALEAFSQITGDLQLYPDGSANELRQAIADVHGLNPDRIICGSGSDEILTMIAHTFLSEGDEAIYCEHGFLVYRIQILAAGATPIVVPEVDETANVDAILDAVTDRTKVIFLANPNNPTGTYLPHDEVRRLHAGLPSHVLLVLDAAYAEYLRRNDYESGIELAGSADNVIMTRTFSKIHGLASLRVGWAFGPAAIIDALNRVRGPFNLTGPALAAASAAIRDRAHVDRAIEHNDIWLERLTSELTALGLRVTPSVANFLLIHFSDEATAAGADAFLRANGVVMRRVGGYGFPAALRMSIGDEEANLLTLDLLGRYLRETVQ